MINFVKGLFADKAPEQDQNIITESKQAFQRWYMTGNQDLLKKGLQLAKDNKLTFTVELPDQSFNFKNGVNCLK